MEALVIALIVTGKDGSPPEKRVFENLPNLSRLIFKR